MWTAGRFLAWMIYLTTGISFEISEQDQAKLTSPKPAIFVLNHQTEMDAIIFSKICPKRCTMMGKSSLKHIPIFGWILGWVGFIFVDRNDVGRATKTLENAVKMIRNRYYSILVCPEGTRSRFTEPKLLPFKRGAFYLAIRAGVPIIPVVAENYSRVLSSKTKTFRAEKIKVRGKCRF
jgi:lysophosphatidate acyltransferase